MRIPIGLLVRSGGIDPSENIGALATFSIGLVICLALLPVAFFFQPGLITRLLWGGFGLGLMTLACVQQFALLYIQHYNLAPATPVALEPEAAVRLQRGKAWMERQQWQTAIKEFTIAVEISPCAELYHWRAVAYQRAGQLSEAAKDSKDAIQAYRQEGHGELAQALDYLLN